VVPDLGTEGTGGQRYTSLRRFSVPTRSGDGECSPRGQRAPCYLKRYVAQRPARDTTTIAVRFITHHEHTISTSLWPYALDRTLQIEESKTIALSARPSRSAAWPVCAQRSSIDGVTDDLIDIAMWLQRSAEVSAGRIPQGQCADNRIRLRETEFGHRSTRQW
jgi:hypothetical protein